MKKIDLLLNEYGESHQNKTNKLIHWLCVPAIFYSIVGLVWEIPLGPLADIKYNGFQYLNWASLTLCLVFIYYLTLSSNNYTRNDRIFYWLSLLNQHHRKFNS